jgi:hypothetical protein
MKTARILLGLAMMLWVNCSYAQDLPPGPYSSWSPDQQKQAASALQRICSSVCSPYTKAAQGGGQRATYEAAACTAACFYNRLPKDYPGLPGIRQSAEQNYANAKALGSNAPVFVNQR